MPLICNPEGVHDSAAIQDICAARKIEETIDKTNSDVSTIATAVTTNYGTFTGLVEAANTAIEEVKAGGNALKNFLLTTTGIPSQTIAGICTQLTDDITDPCSSQRPDSTFIVGIKASWPAAAGVSALAASTTDRQTQLDQQANFRTDTAVAIAKSQSDLQHDVTRLTGADQTAALSELTNLQSASDELGTLADTLAKTTAQNKTIAAGLPDLQQGGQKYNDFIAARDLLITWHDRMSTLLGRWNDFTNRRIPDPFSMPYQADSGFAFSRTKTTAVTLVRVDQMPGTPAANPETVLSVSVECTSPFTMSAGVAFSTLAEREFGIQAVATPQGSTTTANQFVAVTKSSFHPLPIGMVHVRLWEPSEWFSLQAGFGVAGDIKSESAGGSDADFLIGPSFALFRTMFLTPGLHLGREVSLGGGYRLGDPVPSTVTTPPLQKSYKAAFGFAVTFTKP